MFWLNPLNPYWNKAFAIGAYMGVIFDFLTVNHYIPTQRLDVIVLLVLYLWAATCYRLYCWMAYYQETGTGKELTRDEEVEYYFYCVLFFLIYILYKIHLDNDLIIVGYMPYESTPLTPEEISFFEQDVARIKLEELAQIKKEPGESIIQQLRKYFRI